ncbi:hypothetical protein Pint_09610 [Pistacia integerrima]|uniref:Uncharacterized protein n=1 Tax=Pistacia integerrima TaxID=434235 RepID=A0ACC0XH73_9ROSI|nr:hypothetical protein Pint_09610 [Pistacia integerrima]
MEGQVFSKSLTKTDINHRLCIPTNSLPMFPPFAEGSNIQSLIVHHMEEAGIVLNLRFYVRRNGHPKPVLAGDWVQFVRRKGLKIGDEVELFRFIDANGEITYTIRLFRHYV